MELLLALALQDWSEDLDAALERARKPETIVAAFFGDGGDASAESRKAFDALPQARDLLRVKLPIDGPVARGLGVRWAPTVLLFRPAGITEESLVTEEDRECLKRLRGRKVSMSMENVSLSGVLSFLGEWDKLKFAFDPSIRDPESVTLTFARNDVTPEEILTHALAARELGWLIHDGLVLIAKKDALPDIRKKRLWTRMKLGELVGLPEMGPEDEKVAALLRKRLTIEFQDTDLATTLKLINQELGSDVLVLATRNSDGRVNSKVKNFTGEALLNYYVREYYELHWYHKDGKILVAEQPERVALTAERLKGFLVRHVEYDEATLPAGAAAEIEASVEKLGSEALETREAAEAALRAWIAKNATARRVLRRCLGRTTDAEVRARLEVLLR